MPRKMLAGVAGSLDRAKRFGKAHKRPQKPEPVTFTLRASLAPSVTVGPSAHTTTVMAAGVASPLAVLKAGEAAEFRAVSGPDADGKVSWSRVGAPPIPKSVS
jgi:hypothetical protein